MERAPEVVYDSAVRPPLTALWRDGWSHRRLVAILVRRDLASRYRRTGIGVAWTLVAPLVYAGAMWTIFSQIAPFSTSGVPYVVYVLSGVVVLNFVTQSMLTVASNVVENTISLRRVFVPATTFAVATSLTALVTLVLSTLVLLAVELAAAAAITWRAVLLPLALGLILLGVASFGMLIGAVGARFRDAFEVARIGTTLLGVATPTFYPLSVVPHWARPIVEANPVYGYLMLYRSLAYGAPLAWWPLASCMAITVLASAVSLVAYERALARVSRA